MLGFGSVVGAVVVLVLVLVLVGATVLVGAVVLVGADPPFGELASVGVGAERVCGWDLGQQEI